MLPKRVIEQEEFWLRSEQNGVRYYEDFRKSSLCFAVERGSAIHTTIPHAPFLTGYQ